MSLLSKLPFGVSIIILLMYEKTMGSLHSILFMKNNMYSLNGDKEGGLDYTEDLIVSPGKISDVPVIRHNI